MIEPLNLHFSRAEMPLAEIDWRDAAFRLTWGRPLEPLRRSIRALGIQEAPVLQPLSSGRFRIVAGRRRLLVLKERGVESCPVRLAAPDRQAGDLLRFSLYDNLGSRTFNVVELALALSRLAQVLAEEDVIRDYLPLLGLPPQRTVLRRFGTLAAVPPHFWPAFIQGRLFPETLDLLAGDLQPWSDLLLTLCLSLRFGYQKQKELLEGLLEMMRRRSLPLETLLRNTGIFDLLGREELSPQQKGDSWRGNLRAERYPALTATEQAFGKLVKEMDLDPRTRLKPPPFFEGGRYELTVQFSDPAELQASLERVQKALNERKLDELP
jgi:hypothetical protein